MNSDRIKRQRKKEMRGKLKRKIKKVEKIKKDCFPDFNEQVLSSHSFSSQPAYRKAFRKGAFEAQYPVKGSQAKGNRKEEDFATASAKLPTFLKEHSKARQAFQGNKIIQVDGNPEPYI